VSFISSTNQRERHCVA